MFSALMKAACDGQIQKFLDVCQEINFPVSLEKTEWGATIMLFLGLLLDSINQVVCIPVEKIQKALELIEYFLEQGRKKATVLQIQKLCGVLNFLCRCVIPGRVFLMRTYALTSSKLLPHHHVRISGETRMDLTVWKTFLNHPQVFCRPFMEFIEVTARDIDMYSDASRNFSKGFGAYCNKSWTYGVWDGEFVEKHQPSIEYLELFGVTVAVLNWIKRLKNKRVRQFCDNESVCHMINNSASKCRNCMVLLRLITLEGLVQNVRIFAKHVRTKKNGKADSLSRLQFRRFWRLDDQMESFPPAIPETIWPISRIWLKKLINNNKNTFSAKEKFMMTIQETSSTTGLSRISTTSVQSIIQKLLTQQNRKSTGKTYLRIWRQFNKFLINLDIKPKLREDRTTLFIGYLISKEPSQDQSNRVCQQSKEYSLMMGINGRMKGHY